MKKEKTFYMNRLLAIIAAIFAALVFLIFRIVYIQVVEGDDYVRAAREQQTSRSSQVLKASRGTIYDRNLNVLAKTETTYDVIIDPLALQSVSETVQESTMTELLRILKMKDRSVLEKYLTDEYSQSQYERFSQGREVSENTKVQIENSISSGLIAGVWLEALQTRIYPNNELAAHVIGFNGDYGLECSYDELLTGTDGLWTSVTGYDGQTSITTQQAVNGADVISTLDQTIQYYLEQAMAEGMREEQCKSAIGIVINPKNYEIYAMADYPTFNLNNVEEIIGLTDWYTPEIKKAEDFNASIWNNAAISSSYEPGSTYKPIFSSIALDCGAISEYQKFTCDAVYDYYDQQFKCAFWMAHGEETIREVIKNSCNIGMIQVSEQLSVQNYYLYQQAFGIGSLTGIDLPGEISVEDLIYTENMGPVELATTSFGQGFNVTPLQLLRAECAVVNNGWIGTPHVVREVRSADGSLVYEASVQPQRQIISERASAIVRDGMEAVANDNDLGEALDGYRIGGKTGTAEEGNYEDEEMAYMVSFVAFAPIDDPQVGILIVLDNTVTNTSTAAIQVASNALGNILPYLNIYPENEGGVR